MKRLLGKIRDRIRAEFQPLSLGVYDPYFLETAKMAHSNPSSVIGHVVRDDEGLWVITSVMTGKAFVIGSERYYPCPNRQIMAIQYFLPLQHREEFVGDIHEIYADLIKKDYTRIEIRLVILGHLVSVFWHTLRFKLSDFFERN